MKKNLKKAPIKAYIVLAFIGYGFYLTIFHDKHTFWDGGIKLIIFVFACSITLVPVTIFIFNVIKGLSVKESVILVRKYFIKLWELLIDGAKNIDK